MCSFVDNLGLGLLVEGIEELVILEICVFVYESGNLCSQLVGEPFKESTNEESGCTPDDTESMLLSR